MNLIWVFIVMRFSRLHVVAVNIIHPFDFIGLNVFPHDRVSMHQEPRGIFQKQKHAFILTR